MMMIRETAAGAHKLLALVVGQRDFLPNGPIYCSIGSGPIGGVKNSKEITCELPTGHVASVHCSTTGKGSVGIFNVNGNLVLSFLSFICAF